MYRDIYAQLANWKKSPRRKPLVINGARQVGKTFALKEFGRTAYEKVVYLNFEKDEKLANFFESSLDPYKLISILGIHSNIEIEPTNTLLIFDEVQECPKALNSLKYFCEEAANYHVVSAGSLLGVKTTQTKGFPVGKVNFLHLFPLSFFEFLSATNNEKMRRFLEGLAHFEPIPTPLHDNLIELLKTYLFVGGMPEAVVEFVKHNNLKGVREVQKEILSAYEKDFAKHAPLSQVMKITNVWHQVPSQLAKENKKFVFAAIRKSARGRDYDEAIQWLVDAGLIHKSFCVETPKFPLSSYADNNAFKIFLVDVGLLGAQSHLSAHAIIEGNQLFTEFKGALTENYSAQELKASLQRDLFYWTSSGIAEIDFLVESDHEIYPLEVKAGISQKKKSLSVYNEKYHPEVLLRSSLMNLKHDGNIINIPLYLISRLTQLLQLL